MLIQADARSLPLADGCVQCVVTSPPYFGLRDYGTGTWDGGDPACVHSCGGQVQDTKAPSAITTGVRPGCDASKCRKCGAQRVDRQLGLEASPADYVAALVGVAREIWRVLTPDGVFWLNLGDSYASSSCVGRKDSFGGREIDGKRVTSKQLEKPTAIDRVGMSGLQSKNLLGIPWRVAFALQADGWYLRSDIIWSKPNPMPESVTDRPTKAHEYLFLLTKQPAYYYDAQAIAELSLQPIGPAKETGQIKAVILGQSGGRLGTNQGAATRNKRSVWTIPTMPYAGAHFATMPEALVEPCILAGSRLGDVILDPFSGSGTVLAVAERTGRRSVGVDLNPAYHTLAKRRTAQRGLRFDSAVNA